jgi:hypothetical protein
MNKKKFNPVAVVWFYGMEIEVDVDGKDDLGWFIPPDRLEIKTQMPLFINHNF